MKNNAIKQLNFTEIEQVHGGHAGFSHKHLLGLPLKQVIGIVALGFTVLAANYEARPRLITTIALILIGMGSYALYKRSQLENDSQEYSS